MLPGNGPEESRIRSHRGLPRIIERNTGPLVTSAVSSHALQGANPAGVRIRAVGNTDLASLPILIGLAPAQRDRQAVTTEGAVGSVQCDQLRCGNIQVGDDACSRSSFPKPGSTAGASANSSSSTLESFQTSGSGAPYQRRWPAEIKPVKTKRRALFRDWPRTCSASSQNRCSLSFRIIVRGPSGLAF